MLLGRLFCLVLPLLHAEAKDPSMVGDNCLSPTDPKGLNYDGKISKTKLGYTCQRWDRNKPHKIKRRPKNASSYKNYCRNPQGSKSMPWCYTTKKKKTWDYCDVPICTSNNGGHRTLNTDSTNMLNSGLDTCGVQSILPLFQKQNYRVTNGELVPHSRVKRVIGGEVALHGSWPWMASISRTKKGIAHWCGGAIIAPTWVLTAAHCLATYPKVKYMRVLAGHHIGLEIQEQIRRVKRYILYPSFDRVYLDRDIALVQLTKPFQMTDHIQTICLPPPDYIVPGDTYCIAAGWGRTHDSTYKHELKQVVVPVRSYQTCVDVLGVGLRNKTHMCAGWRGGDHDACPGDSGGPLVCLHENRWTVQGITSWSFHMCKTNEGDLTAYTRVSKFIKWIDKQKKTYKKDVDGGADDYDENDDDDR